MRRAILLLAGMATLGIPAVAESALRAPLAPQSAHELCAQLIADAARRFGVPAAWIRAIMRAESRGDRRARSAKGAIGLMQIMPETWALLRAHYRLGSDPFDPHDNIFAGAALLRELHDRYGSPGFLAAYNAGPGRYEEFRDRHRPLPAETIAYVAALVPFVGGGEMHGPVLVAASGSPPWTRASLFITRSAGDEQVADAAPAAPSRGAPPIIAVRDLSGIAPQPAGLFVATSSAGSKR
jgi:hypothetical protein